MSDNVSDKVSDNVSDKEAKLIARRNAQRKYLKKPGMKEHYRELSKAYYAKNKERMKKQRRERYARKKAAANDQ